MSSIATRKAHTARTARATHRAAAGRLRRAAPAVVDTPRRSVGPTSVRLTRRGRFVVVLLLVALLSAAFAVGRTGTEAATTTPPPPAVVHTTVEPGESLWSVARRIAPQSDPRDVMRQIAALNELSGSGLQVGQQLLLPA